MLPSLPRLGSGSPDTLRSECAPRLLTGSSHASSTYAIYKKLHGAGKGGLLGGGSSSSYASPPAAASSASAVPALPRPTNELHMVLSDGRVREARGGGGAGGDAGGGGGGGGVAIGIGRSGRPGKRMRPRPGRGGRGRASSSSGQSGDSGPSMPPPMPWNPGLGGMQGRLEQIPQQHARREPAPVGAGKGKPRRLSRGMREVQMLIDEVHVVRGMYGTDGSLPPLPRSAPMPETPEGPYGGSSRQSLLARGGGDTPQFAGMAGMGSGGMPMGGAFADLPADVFYEEYSFIPRRRMNLSSWGPLVTDKSLHEMCRVAPSVRALKVADCQNIGDRGLLSVARSCRQLKELDVARTTRLTATVLEQLPVGSVLSVLRFRACTWITDAALMTAAHGLTDTLEILDVGQCPQLTDTALAVVCRSCTHLRELYVDGCTRVGDRTAKCIGKHLHLELLTLDDCPSLTDTGVGAILAAGSNLRGLSLASCSKLTDAGVRHFLERRVIWGYKAKGGFSHLRLLNLANCPDLTDVGIGWITAGCFALKDVDLSGCTGLQDLGLRALSSLVGCIELLKIKGCYNITSEGLGMFFAPCQASREGGEAGVPTVSGITVSVAAGGWGAEGWEEAG